MPGGEPSDRSSGLRSASSCSGYEAPPEPPAEVQARTSRRTRSGCRMATSWATMPPKETPKTRQVVPTDGVEECGDIVSEVGHGVGPGGHAALPQAALVVGQDLEGGGQWTAQPGLLAQVTSGARDAQQPLTAPCSS